MITRSLKQKREIPGISIVMRAYNQGDFISDAVESVLNQTFSDFELIIVNDGSTDNTVEEIEKFNDDRIILLNQDNRGRGYAGNLGISFAKGKYIAFLDSDDLWEKDFLKYTSTFFLENPKTDIVYSGWSLIDENGRIIKEVKTKIKNNYKYEFLFGAIFPINSALVKKRCFLQFGSFDTSITYGEDWLLWTKFAYYNCKFAVIERSLSYYRRHNSNTTKNLSLLEKEAKTTTKKIFTLIGKLNTREEKIALIHQNMHLAQYSFEAKNNIFVHKYLEKALQLVSTIKLSNDEIERIISLVPLTIRNFYFIKKIVVKINLLNRIVFYIRFIKNIAKII